MARTRKKAAEKFPATIYVNREQDTNSDDSYLLASEDTSMVDDGQPVAVYELREIRTKRVAHSLE